MLLEKGEQLASKLYIGITQGNGVLDPLDIERIDHARPGGLQSLIHPSQTCLGKFERRRGLIGRLGERHVANRDLTFADTDLGVGDQSGDLDLVVSLGVQAISDDGPIKIGGDHGRNKCDAQTRHRCELGAKPYL